MIGDVWYGGDDCEGSMKEFFVGVVKEVEG